MQKFIWLCGALLLLSACGDGRDPGYICMTNCPHECADGIKGDQCRADMQQQSKQHDNASDSPIDHHDINQ